MAAFLTNKALTEVAFDHKVTDQTRLGLCQDLIIAANNTHWHTIHLAQLTCQGPWASVKAPGLQ